jgi:hypothetical protein
VAIFLSSTALWSVEACFHCVALRCVTLCIEHQFRHAHVVETRGKKLVLLFQDISMTRAMAYWVAVLSFLPLKGRLWVAFSLASGKTTWRFLIFDFLISHLQRDL